MSLIKNKIRRTAWGSFLKKIVLLLLLCDTAGAVGRDELRVKAGLDLFPSLLTADLDISKKKGRDGYITIVLLYLDNKTRALDMAGQISRLKEIHGIPIHVDVTDDPAMSMYAAPPAGIFITQPLNSRLADVVDYAEKNSVILFSPFKGDVEKGVLGGLSISDRVLPYINKKTMESSKIQIKQFFMRVSVIYEP